jgi:hypothetical protein
VADGARGQRRLEGRPGDLLQAALAGVVAAGRAARRSAAGRSWGP